MEKKLDLDKVEYMWIWEDDYRKNNIVFYGLKDDPVGVEEDYTTSKTSDLVKLIKEKGACKHHRPKFVKKFLNNEESK
mgnify:CR=1 FL=1